MAVLVKEDETGGTVTTVRTETTSDLDVAQILAEQASETAGEGEESAGAAGADKSSSSKTPESSKKAVVSGDGTRDKGKIDDDDSEDEVDFKNLSPAQQKAVAKLYKERRVERREARRQNDRLAELEAKMADKSGGTPTAAKTEVQPVGLKKPIRPVRTSFKSDQEFDAAQDAYEEASFKYRKAMDAAQDQAKKADEQGAQAVERFNEMAEEFIEQTPDYEEVMEDASVKMTHVMFGHLIDFGPSLGYYLAKNPKEAGRISKMGDSEAERALTRIEIKLEDESTKAKEAKAKAEEAKGKGKGAAGTKEKPAPPAPVAGRTTSVAAGTAGAPKSFKEREKDYAKRHPGALNYQP